ncbi:MAG: ankyrin repeat domain-containing protein, partial [Lysobacterales bacterium]
MSIRPSRGGSWFARLRYFLPALALTAPVAFITHPATLLLLLLALPLYAAAAARMLRACDDATWFELLGRGALAYLLMELLLAALVAALVGWPTSQLLRTPDAASAVWLSLGVAVLLLLMWRLWPVFGLVWVWDNATVAESEGSASLAALRRSWAFALPLTRGFAHALSGLGVSLTLSLLVVGGFCLAGLGPFGAWPADLRIAVLLVWGFLLAPLTSLLTLWRCQRLLHSEHAILPFALSAIPPSNVGERVVVGHGDASELDRAGFDATIDPYPPSDPAALAAGALTAAASGDVERALDLLRQGADPAAMPALDARDQRSLPMIAATLPDLRLLREIIARGGDVNRAVGGLTPLLAATRDSLQGRVDAVMTLLTNGADPRIADAAGNTALHHAARCTDPALAAILLDTGAERDAINSEGHSPLAIAAITHNEVVLRCLLDRGARAEPPRGLPALIAAMSGAEDRPGPIKLLLKHKARIDGRDVLGRTALHAAALHGHALSVAALLAAGADVDAHDSAGVTPLMEAARAGHDAVLRKLIERRPAPNEVDGAGRTALVIACQSRRATADTVQALLAAGVDPLLATRDGKRALDFAVNAGRWREVALLDPAYQLPASVREHAHEDALDAEAEHAASATAHIGPDRVALLAQALAQRHYGSADELLALAPALDAEALAESFLACAARIDSVGYASLLRHGFDPGFVDRDGRALLHRLAALRPLPLRALRLLRESGASPAGGCALAELLAGALPADAAGRSYALRLAHDWLEAGADASRASICGETPLALAVRLGAIPIMHALLARGSDARRTSAGGRGLLHLVAVQGNCDDDS